ncbi:MULTISPECIES: TraR/DksA family transcriptional regulator [Marinobacter]|uniref:Transcriptional regulator, TraR/DksA family n=1 Tax=Marinobacter segnicrescens TaxID=430453 RepID=A0A1H9YSD5_9GAMM|nr:MULTISPECIES: TraR/DksA family transcriptional regulator [Marinobacter]UZD64391.1 TraR/DksA family transcriptional regulator [Marinobacter sp. AN1]SES72079.1 transcriptional regulator, TraR/DksA family [Marinobacter segnicrescens]
MANTRTEELQRLKQELTRRLERYEAHQHRESGKLEADFEEQAVQLQNDEVVDSLEQEVREELRQVIHALDRIDQGEGGLCERCGNEINPERLNILPWTSLCVRCAEAAE